MNQNELFDMIADWHTEHPDHGLLACVTDGKATRVLSEGDRKNIIMATTEAAGFKEYTIPVIFGLLTRITPADNSWWHRLIFRIKAEIILWLVS